MADTEQTEHTQHADPEHAGPEHTDPGLAGVVVLGMHRSGTSAVNGIFRSAGFRVTREDDLMDVSADQPGGHNESLAVAQVNDTILDEIGRTWFEVPSAEEFEPVIESGRNRAAQVLTALLALASPAPLALKDPRINVMMPVWGPVIDHLLHPVLVIRNPIEVAQSLQNRDGTPRPIALASWELCMTAALGHLSGREVTIVHHAELMAAPEIAVDVVSTVSELLRPSMAAHVDPRRAPERLNPSFHRNHSTEDEHRHALTQYQQDLWNYLRSVPAGMQTLTPPLQFTLGDPNTRLVTKAETERVKLIGELNQAKHALAQMTPVLEQAREQIQTSQSQASASLAIVNQTRSDLQRALGDAASMMDKLEVLSGERDAHQARADAAEAESRHLAAVLDALRQAHV